MAYTPTDDTDTSKVNPSDYDSGKGNGKSIFRKINLNVDIATQDELISVYNDLVSQIGTASDAYKTADENLSTALKDWAKGDELSGALHQENQAISAALSAFALSNTVADAYKVTVDHEAGTLAWTIKQGDGEGTTITIPADAVVSAGKLEEVNDKKYLVLSLANANNVSIDVDDLVDTYTGEATDFATVVVDDGKIKAYVSADLISSAAVTEVVGASTDLSDVITIYGARAYADAVAQAAAQSASHTHTNKEVLDGISAERVANWDAAEQNAKDYADEKISSVVGDNTYLTASTDDHAVTVSATDKLTAVVNTVETSASIWDTVTNKADLTALTAEETARTNADEFLSGKIDALSVSLNGAEGDAYVSAYVDGNKVKVETQNRTKSAINAVKSTSATWDDAASVAGVVKATSATWDEVSAKVSKTTYDDAAETLESAISISALNDYQDIDDIINDLIALKAALTAFANTTKTA